MSEFVLKCRVVVVVLDMLEDTIQFTKIEMTQGTAAAHLDGFRVDLYRLLQREINKRHLFAFLKALHDILGFFQSFRQLLALFTEEALKIFTPHGRDIFF